MSDYPNGRREVDMIDEWAMREEPPWVDAYHGFDCELGECDGLDDAIRRVDWMIEELQDLKHELERYK